MICGLKTRCEGFEQADSNAMAKTQRTVIWENVVPALW